MPKDRITILGVRVDKITSKEALDNIRLFLSSKENHYLVTLNSEMIVRAQEDAEFRSIINDADLVVADGMGVLQAASFFKKRKGEFLSDAKDLFFTAAYAIIFPKKVKDILPEKISGVDLITEICGSDFAKGVKIYLLGAEDGVAVRVGEVLQKKYPQIDIVGAEAGIAENFSQNDNERLIERIRKQSPEIVFVALGAPKQEKWICDNITKLSSVRLAMGVGGSFDYISEKIKRAPRIMRIHGLEWLWRLLLQPRRIKRIYNATFKLAWLIFWSKEGMIGE